MDHFILEIPDALPKHLCEEIIRRFDSDDRKRAGHVNYGSLSNEPFVDLELKNAEELFISPLNDWNDIDKSISECVSKSIKIYLNFLKNSFDYNQKISPLGTIVDMQNIVDRGYEIQKTPKGGKYAWHYDGGIGVNDVANIIIYLNTLDYHEGGRTRFIHGRKVRPETGKMLIFPTTWTFVHSGEEVKSDNHKYTCVARIVLGDCT